MSEIDEASHAERIRRASQELADHPKIIEDFGKRFRIGALPPIDESGVSAEVRRYRLTYEVEQKRREFLKAQMELAAVNGPFINWAVRLDDLHTRNCRVFPHRLAMVDHLPKGAVIAEIGTETGRFSAQILERAKPREFHLVDLSFREFEREPMRAAIENGVARFHETDSVAFLSACAPATFDWIYIDADHFYNGVKRDIRVAIDKVKPDGLLVFNDYTLWSSLESFGYGIPAAVHELAIEHGWELAYLALEPQGYYDVALRRIPNYRS